MAKKIKSHIVVSLQIPGIHRWRACPIKEVSYLKDYHRHVFYIKAVKPVSHDDRDIEIIMFKKQLADHINKTWRKEPDGSIFFGDESCEMIAKDLINMFDLSSCSVLEDNENGAFLTESGGDNE